MADAKAALLRLHLAESRLKRAYDLAETSMDDSSRRRLFIANTRDSTKIRENFDADFITVELAIAELPDINPATHAERLLAFEEKYFFVMATVDALVDGSKDHVQATTCTKVSSSRVSLPKITLPRFEGDPRQWPNFANLFNTLVSNNEDISLVEKLAYLRGTLHGEALGLVQSLPMSEANFKVAWKLLVDRYENKRAIINLHVDALLQAPLVSSNNPSSLRRLLSAITENLNALEALDVPVAQWDLLLLPILCKCLDAKLLTQWELTLGVELPAVENFIAFLEKHCRAQEAVTSVVSKNPGPQASRPRVTTPASNWRQPCSWSNHQSKCFVSSNQLKCCLCHSAHKLSSCQKFSCLTAKQRFSIAKEHRLCINCLSPSHVAKVCPSSACRQCGARHHMLLHFESKGSEGSGPLQEVDGLSSRDETRVNRTVSVVTPVSALSSVVLLSTAQLHVLDAAGFPHVARALLDTASQASFISEHCCQRLGLSRKRTHLPIHGLSSAAVGVAKSFVSIVLTPCGSPDLQFSIDAFILSNITSKLPSAPLSREVRQSVAHLKLADPDFDVSRPIDLLIEAELVPRLLTGGKVEGSPMALSSVLGWILMGRVEAQPPTVSSTYCISLLTSPNLETVMHRFWEVEEFPPVKYHSVEEIQCEREFVENHSRDCTGRYTVSLPFRSSGSALGVSRPQALNRLLRLERRLEGDPLLKQMYSGFMDDYLAAGHMEKVPACDVSSSLSYYLPHHCVVKPESSTTKLRVVFDASSKGQTGVSLNDVLLTGPRLQRDIIEVLLKFRLHKIVFTADIKQMYRQIAVCPDHQDIQRILWRADGDVTDYRLKTVTYGVSSAPYLALRTLQHLAEDEKKRFPMAAEVLKSDVYVDDVVTGAPSVESALTLQKELISLLNAGGFKLRKFVSNHPDLLDWLPVEDVEDPQALSMDQDCHIVKVLGLQWTPKADCFSYKIQLSVKEATKRNILSELARIFDPLGWLSPLTLFAKHLIQTLWLENLDWDVEPPGHIVDKWTRFNRELPLLASVTVPRYISGPTGSLYELHGFSDSSETGYAAVVYLRIASSEEVTTTLVAGKSKVAPVKVQSIPRLELCGALLLANLITHVMELVASAIILSSIHTWTDSQIVLCWVNSSPHKLKTFAANRVSKIQELTRPSWWRHVPSESNPADCASRGLLPSELVGHPLWWTGPAWLRESPEHWPACSQSVVTEKLDPMLLEQKVTVLATFGSVEEFEKLLTCFSSLTKLLRVFSLVLRFSHNCRSSIEARLTGPLKPSELDKSLEILLLFVQSVELKEELAALRNGRRLSPQLRKLVPFIDGTGLLRVGGRLQHSELPFDHKHASLLPKTHSLTDLIISHYYERNQHPGLRTLQGILREKFWIMSDRHAITRRLRNCLRCWRTRPSTRTPLMGNLPGMRVQQVKPFAKSGVDYAGPFSIKASRTRKSPVLKAYLCVFVCCATKAVHVEVASDLSTEVFLAAYKRFVARRGRSSDIYSDCGTNFVGAHNRLLELQQLLASSSLQQKVEEAFSPLGVAWHFNPPAAPHFGGLWEAGVKSFKTHLVRVIGDQVLTFEELLTVAVQVEAVLNSRPLSPLSSDPNDFSALTPGHFLTLEPLVAVPEPNQSNVRLTVMQRWQLVEQLHQEFWRRWQRDYLHTLQQRSKWHEPGDNLAPNQLVLIKEDRQPPLQWRLGRVQEVHPGSDGVVRVATVRTANGTLKRPVVRLCPLPNQF